MMDATVIRTKVLELEEQRAYLLTLLERMDIGTLRLDVNQALEELDELLEEYNQTFPASPIGETF
ncbi:MAG: hypothetical protein SAJ12_19750 [Jaaginema sp. PMC 1079.18]|nr:hypothetical protein [Jaaginema sp. PMC 1080.18]MEC4853221.1 hypothetical protein [Jaaginema sp. PMC 1079.18]MEC4868552.1 hypothetical protein [Jaaginema sp. PMC 1078.18]